MVPPFLSMALALAWASTSALSFSLAVLAPSSVLVLSSLSLTHLRIGLNWDWAEVPGIGRGVTHEGVRANVFQGVWAVCIGTWGSIRANTSKSASRLRP